MTPCQNDPHVAANWNHGWINGARTTKTMRWQAHQRLDGYASTMSPARQFPIWTLVCEIYGFARGGHPWELTTNPSILRISLMRMPFKVWRSSTPCDFEARWWCHGHNLRNKTAKLTSWACSDQNNPKPNCSSKCMSMILSMESSMFWFWFWFPFSRYLKPWFWFRKL